MIELLAKLEEGVDEGLSKETKEALESLESHMTELMSCAKKPCRRLYKNNYNFSPKVKHWLEKGRAIS